VGDALGTLFLDGFGVDAYPLEWRGRGHSPLSEGFPHPELPHLDRLLAYQRDDFLDLDEATLRHLEIFETWRSRSRQGSLLETLDHTVTPWVPGA